MEFKTKTNWCVITGAPSSGKTSVIEELAKRGYTTEPEAARELMQDCLKHGQKIEDIRSHAAWLQNEILRLKLQTERRQDPKELIFLDRGIPDSLTYFRIGKLDLKPAKAAALEFQYCAVFIFDRLPFISDGIRTETEEIVRQIDLDLDKDYRDLGYAPVRVPVMPIQARADFIVDKINT